MMRQYLVVILLLLGLGASPALANQCAMSAIAAAKRAGSSQTQLNKLYDTYFGEALARRPVSGIWKNLSPADRKKQIDYTRRFVVSIARDLAAYADATFKWKGDVAFVTLNGKTTKIRVSMAGSCTFSDVCVDGTCLASLLGDVRKLAKNK